MNNFILCFVLQYISSTVNCRKLWILLQYHFPQSAMELVLESKYNFLSILSYVTYYEIQSYIN